MYDREVGGGQRRADTCVREDASFEDRATSSVKCEAVEHAVFSARGTAHQDGTAIDLREARVHQFGVVFDGIRVERVWDAEDQSSGGLEHSAKRGERRRWVRHVFQNVA